jgi:hypothetical protein
MSPPCPNHRLSDVEPPFGLANHACHGYGCAFRDSAVFLTEEEEECHDSAVADLPMVLAARASPAVSSEDELDRAASA